MASAITRLPSIQNMNAGYDATKKLLPESKYKENIESLTNKINSLRQSLTEKTGEVFKRKVAKITRTVKEEKEKCKMDLFFLNGDYYEDPISALKRAWDALVQSVDTAIGFKVERADQLGTVAELLYNDPDGGKKSANDKIEHYKNLETMRNRRQAQLNQILATEKAGQNLDEMLKSQKEMLKQKHLELCGNYFGDPQGLLDQAWQKYQNEKSQGLEGKESLAAYQALDKSRKEIEATLYEIEQQLSTSVSHRTFEQLTIQSINQQIQAFTKELQSTPAPKKGKSQKEITTIATKDALTNAGYIDKVDFIVFFPKTFPTRRINPSFVQHSAR